MRIPFPVKVFFALLAVVLAGALPTYIYIETSFVGQLTQARVDETAHRASLLAEQLRPLGRDARLELLHSQTRTQPERITYVGPTGVVLFDSGGNEDHLDDHSTRPEVALALGRPTDLPTLDVQTPGFGAATRESASTGMTNVYVAVRIDSAGEVIRLAFPARDLATLSDKLRAAFRNSQALALSVALLLSVVAAFVFMRPLQRLARSAQAIARGDYTASESWRGSDEIGDVGNALNTLALDLRQQLATAQASETLLIQAAEFLEMPLAVVGRRGDILVVNGSFRRMVEDPTTDAEEVIGRLLGSKKYDRTYAAVRDKGADGQMRWTRKKLGVVLQMHHLERPGTDPLVLLTVHDETTRGSSLPKASDVRPMPLNTLIDGALDRIANRVSECVFEVEYVDAEVDMPVVDVEGRVELALSIFLESAGRGASRVKLCAAANDLDVALWVDGELPAAPVRLVRHLLGACGGSVTNGEYVTLHIARA